MLPGYLNASSGALLYVTHCWARFPPVSSNSRDEQAEVLTVQGGLDDRETAVGRWDNLENSGLCALR
jgi:hypothetical protein